MLVYIMLLKQITLNTTENSNTLKVIKFIHLNNDLQNYSELVL